MPTILNRTVKQNIQNMQKKLIFAPYIAGTLNMKVTCSVTTVVKKCTLQNVTIILSSPTLILITFAKVGKKTLEKGGKKTKIV